MGLAVLTVASGGLPIVESTVGGTPVTEATNGRGVPVTKVIGKPGLPVVFETIGAAAAAAVGFDDASVINAVLSNGKKTVTHTNTTGNSGARTLSAKTFGKYYFEVTCDAIFSANNAVGILLSSGTLANLLSGTNCFMVLLGSGNIWNSNVFSTKTLGAIVAGNVIGIAVDLTSHLGWIRNGAGNWNGTAGANPATGVGGLEIYTGAFDPAVGFAASSSPNGAYTGNFGTSAYANAAPAGYANWTTTAESFPAAPPITGLIGWWDASLTSSLNLNGSIVNSIVDQSGSGTSLSAMDVPTPTRNLPTYNATGLNGKPTMMFAAGSQQIIGTGHFPLGGSTMTAFAVVAMSSSAPANARIHSYIGGLGTGKDWNDVRGFSTSRDAANAQLYLIRNSVQAFAPMSITVPHRVIFTVNAAGAVTIYIDGVPSSGTVTAGTFGIYGFFSLGSTEAVADAAGSWTGAIAEAGVSTNNIDATTAAALDTYLKNKWGL